MSRHITRAKGEQLNLQEVVAVVQGRGIRAVQGDMSQRINGLSWQLINLGPETAFLMFDTSWHRRSRAVFRQSQLPPPHLVKVLEQNEVRTLVCSADYQGAAFLRDKNVVFVDNTLAFLHDLALSIRRTFTQETHPVIGVTGSVGKSTTASMIAHAYRNHFQHARVQLPHVDTNTLSQVLGSLTRAHRFDVSVLEIAGSAFELLEKRNRSLSPDIAIVTSIASVHDSYMGGLKETAELKSGVFSAPPSSSSTAIINVDAPYSEVLIKRAEKEGWNLSLYGKSEGLDFVLTEYDAASHSVTAGTSEGLVEYTLGAPGEHMAINSLAVLATMRALGIGGAEIGGALETFSALKGRGEQADIPLAAGGSVRLIDESYNSNPASVRAVLTMLGDVAASRPGRAIAVLADMSGEMGQSEADEHDKLTSALSDPRIERVFMYGPQMSRISRMLNAPSRYTSFQNKGELAKALIAELCDGDTVVVKGANAMGLVDVVSALSSR